uniref:Centromere protein P n=1 Tax=Knipowitschia caucasica TaxID=637954 RepID=A0AAV2MIR0_KNICA
MFPPLICAVILDNISLLQFNCQHKGASEGMEAQLESELLSLETEVSHLHKQLLDQQKIMDLDFRGNMEQALALLCARAAVPSEFQAMVSRLQEEVLELEEDVRRQTQMNGIRVDHCTRRRIQRTQEEAVAQRAGGSNSSHQFCVSGVCSDLSFQVEFQLSELKFGTQTKRSLSHLNIVLEDSDLQGFSSFLSRVEESQDLLLFFRTLRTFSRCCDERQRTFNHFQVTLSRLIHTLLA